MQLPTRSFSYCFIAAALFGLLSCGSAHKTTDTLAGGQKAEQWFKKQQWGKGLTLNVHPSVDKSAFYEQYQKNPALWEKAFAYLRDTDLEQLKPGKYPILGDTLFATVTEGPLKDFEQTGWESHRKYIDLQYIISGREKIGVASVTGAQVTNPYQEKKDAANYSVEGTYYIAAPGVYFLFFPGDAHRPSIKVEGYDIVKKIVLKIRVAE